VDASAVPALRHINAVMASVVFEIARKHARHIDHGAQVIEVFIGSGTPSTASR
jgi:hypothetical protein